MTGDQPPFGPSNQGPADVARDDLGGSKWIPPRYGDRERLLISTEKLKQLRWSRWLTIIAAGLIGLLCAACLFFSFYIGSKYVAHIERLDTRTELQLALAIKSINSAPAATDKEESPNNNKEDLSKSATSLTNIEYIAPLLPGIFSSLFAVISIITLARFVSTYGKEETEQKPEYGAIKALVSEIAELIKSLKGGKD